MVVRGVAHMGRVDAPQELARRRTRMGMNLPTTSSSSALRRLAVTPNTTSTRPASPARSTASAA